MILQTCSGDHGIHILSSQKNLTEAVTTATVSMQTQMALTGSDLCMQAAVPCADNSHTLTETSWCNAHLGSKDAAMNSTQNNWLQQLQSATLSSGMCCSHFLPTVPPQRFDAKSLHTLIAGADGCVWKEGVPLHSCEAHASGWPTQKHSSLDATVWLSQGTAQKQVHNSQ